MKRLGKKDVSNGGLHNTNLEFDRGISGISHHQSSSPRACVCACAACCCAGRRCWWNSDHDERTNIARSHKYKVFYPLFLGVKGLNLFSDCPYKSLRGAYQFWLMKKQSSIAFVTLVVFSIQAFAYRSTSWTRQKSSLSRSKFSTLALQQHRKTPSPSVVPSILSLFLTLPSDYCENHLSEMSKRKAEASLSGMTFAITGNLIF